MFFLSPSIIERGAFILRLLLRYHTQVQPMHYSERKSGWLGSVRGGNEKKRGYEARGSLLASNQITFFLAITLFGGKLPCSSARLFSRVYAIVTRICVSRWNDHRVSWYLENFWVSEFPSLCISEFLNFQIPRRFPNFSSSKFPSSQVPRFLNSWVAQFPKLLDPYAPKSLNFFIFEDIRTSKFSSSSPDS